MNLHLTSSTVGDPKETRKFPILAACGAAVALAVGIGAWQLTAGGNSETGTATSQPVRTGEVTAQVGNRPDVDIPADGPLGNIGPAVVGPSGGAATRPLGGVAEQMRERPAQPSTTAPSRWDTMGGVAEQMLDFPHLVPDASAGGANVNRQSVVCGTSTAADAC